MMTQPQQPQYHNQMYAEEDMGYRYAEPHAYSNHYEKTYDRTYDNFQHYHDTRYSTGLSYPAPPIWVGGALWLVHERGTTINTTTTSLLALR